MDSNLQIRFWMRNGTQRGEGMRRFAQYITIILAASPAWAAPLTLQEFLRDVAAVNPMIRSVHARAAAEQERAEAAGYLDDPFFAAGPDERPLHGSSEGVIRFQVSQGIPFPGKLAARERAASARATAAAADESVVLREIRVRAVQAYWRTYYLSAAEALNRDAARLLREAMASAEARYVTGSDGHHGLLLAKVELGKIEAERLRLARDHDVAASLMNELRALAPETPVELLPSFTADRTPPPLVVERHPEFLAASAGTVSSEADLDAARATAMPDFVLQAMLMRAEGQSKDADAASDMAGDSAEAKPMTSWGVMLGFNIPLFSLARRPSVVDAAAHDRDGAKNAVQGLELRLRAEELAARRQLETARDLVKLYKETLLPATKSALDNAFAGYKMRRQPLSPLLETIRIRYVQELELLAARIDVELATLRAEELLSAPPLLRLAPSQPSVFGGAEAGMGMEGSGTDMSGDPASMGGGLQQPAPMRPRGGNGGNSGASGSMQGM